MDRAKEFGELLRQLRKEAGRSMAEVAEHLDFSVPYVSDVERGKRAPLAHDRIVALASFLNVSTAPLLAKAAVSRGAFELDASGEMSSLKEKVGAALMRGWPDLTEEQLRTIDQVLEGDD